MNKSLLPAILLLLSVLAVNCAKNDATDTPAVNGGDRLVVTSFYPVHIAALNVAEGAEGIRLVNLSPPRHGCVHDYSLTPAEAALIGKASVLIVNGGGMETFLEKAASLNGDIVLIDAGAGGGEDYRGGLSRRDNADPHTWMSVEKHIGQIRAMAERLAAWDTANAKIYVGNARNYAARLTVLLENSLRERMRFTSHTVAFAHGGFENLASELGLTVAAVIEKSHGAGSSAAEMAAAADAINAMKPRAMFTESGRPSPSASAVAAETGLPVYELEMITSGPMEKDAYIQAVERNLATLKEALK